MSVMIIFKIKNILYLMITISKMKKEVDLKMLKNRFVINVKFIVTKIISFLNRYIIMKIFNNNKKRVLKI